MPNAFYQYDETHKTILKDTAWKDGIRTDWVSTAFSVYEGEYIDLHCTEEVKAAAYEYKDRARKVCPTIDSLIGDLEKEGKLANSFVSRIIPGTIIEPHVGRTDKWLRIHLGILCDPDCKITVGSESQAWEEGKLLAFIDGPPVPHSVHHNGTKDRVIFSIDLRREYVRSFL